MPYHRRFPQLHPTCSIPSTAVPLPASSATRCWRRCPSRRSPPAAVATPRRPPRPSAAPPSRPRGTVPRRSSRLSGTNLDSAGLSVSSNGCKNMTRSTTGQLVSTATNAYYTCTVSGALTNSVVDPVERQHDRHRAVHGAGAPGEITCHERPGRERRHRAHAQGGQGADDGRQLPELRSQRLLRQHDLPSHRQADQRSVALLRRAGWRLRADRQRRAAGAQDDQRSIPVETAGGNNVQWSIAMARITSVARPPSSSSTPWTTPRAGQQLLGLRQHHHRHRRCPVDPGRARQLRQQPAQPTIDCLPQPDVTIKTPAYPDSSDGPAPGPRR